MQLIERNVVPDPQQRVELREREQRFQLARVLRATEQMLQAAEEGDWDQVGELEALRRVELEECFAFQENGEPSPLVAEAFATLLHLNEQLVGLVRFARTRVQDEQRQHATTMNAVRSYGEFER